METQSKIKILFLILGAFLFNWFFWNEGFGLNVLLFSLFLLIGLNYFNSNLLKSTLGRVVSIGTLVCSLQVMLYNSDFSLWMLFISFLFLPALGLNDKINNLVYTLMASISNYIKLPSSLFREFKTFDGKNMRIGKFWNVFKLTVIPILFLFLFFIIFRLANDAFSQLTDKIFTEIERFNNWIFSCISIDRIFFFFVGFSFIAGFLYRAKKLWGENDDLQSQDNVSRNRKYKLSFFSKKALSLGLKNEYHSAVIMLAMINVLLLVINLLDINFVWINFKYTPAINLTKFVHEGTYLLIFSILLSISIQLYFFRANLNFYSKAKLLRLLNYIWIVQNCILTISVAVRNSHYIEHFGLAYKRIGVMFFLVLVIFGLLSVYYKIRNKKSSYFIIRVNILATYIFLVFLNFVDWDTVICKYNLKNCSDRNLDVNFIMHLSDKTLAEVEKNKSNILELVITKYDLAAYNNDDIGDRIKEFKNKKSKQGWLSWNWIEAKTLRQLNEQNR